jgi:hypothetical protein
LRKNSGGGTVYGVALAASAQADADAIYEYVTESVFCISVTARGET